MRQASDTLKPPLRESLAVTLAMRCHVLPCPLVPNNMVARPDRVRITRPRSVVREPLTPAAANAVRARFPTMNRSVVRVVTATRGPSAGALETGAEAAAVAILGG